MTTIKSVFEYSPQTLLVETGKHEGETYLRINNGKSPMGDAMVATADLLAALDAVPREDFDKAVALSEERQSALEELDLNPWKARAQEARAERDALAATVERVGEVVARFLDPHGQDAVVAARVAEKLRAALDPKPALPTEAGSLILLGDKPLCLNADGWWMGLDGGPFTADYIESRDWKPAKVVAG